MLRNRTILAFVATLGILLHAGTATASVWCAMAGMLTTSCCCATDELPDGPVLQAPSDSCCRDAIAAPSFDLLPTGPALAALPVELPWEQASLEPPLLAPVAQAPVPTCTSPPLAALASVVLLH